MTLKGGLSQLTAKLATELEPSRIRLGCGVEAVLSAVYRPVARLRVQLEGGTALDADSVILALPAHAAARILVPLSAELGGRLAEIPYSSAMTVSLGFQSDQLAALPPGFGFLVPAKEKRRLLACTFVHRKFPANAAEGKALLRCFLGGARDPEVLRISDAEALSTTRRELREILGLSAEPLFTRIHRWPNSMAQYVVGHEERLGAIQAQLEKLPGVHLAGNAYSGIGISDCIRTGKQAGERALAALRS